MKRNILLTLCLLTATLAVSAQTKPVQTPKQDSVHLATKEVQTIRNNAVIIQQTLHRMDMSALLRDKLDSVFNQSVVIIDERLKNRKP